MIKKNFLFLAACVLFSGLAHGKTSKIKTLADKLSGYKLELQYKNNFSSSKDWAIEKLGDCQAIFKGNRLELYSPVVITVWLKKRLFAPIMIEYYVEMIDKGGKYDNLTDLNLFFMSEDPNNPTDFFASADRRKNARLKDYSYLNMYYVGYAANKNTTTRLRRLRANDKRPLLPGHDLRGYKNKPNQKVKVNVLLIGNNFVFCVDDKVIYDWQDPKPQPSGWFAFRTFNSHMYIYDLKIYKIVKNAHITH
jgi:hypothetical protein